MLRHLFITVHLLTNTTRYFVITITDIPAFKSNFSTTSQFTPIFLIQNYFVTAHHFQHPTTAHHFQNPKLDLTTVNNKYRRL